MNLLITIEGNYAGVFILVLLIMFGLPILFAIIGAILYNKNKKGAKVFFTIAVVYLIISLGICGTMML